MEDKDMAVKDIQDHVTAWLKSKEQLALKLTSRAAELTPTKIGDTWRRMVPRAWSSEIRSVDYQVIGICPLQVMRGRKRRIKWSAMVVQLQTMDEAPPAPMFLLNGIVGKKTARIAEFSHEATKVREA